MKKVVALGLIPLLLTACSGGKNGNTTSTTTPTPTPTTTTWRVVTDSPYTTERAILDFALQDSKTKLVSSKLPANWNVTTSLTPQGFSTQALNCPAPKLSNGTYLCVKLTDAQGHTEGIAVESPDNGATFNVYTDWASTQLKNPVGDALPVYETVNFLSGTLKEITGTSSYPPATKNWSAGSGTLQTTLISRPGQILSTTINSDGSFQLPLPSQPAGVIGLHNALLQSANTTFTIGCTPFQGTETANTRYDYPFAKSTITSNSESGLVEASAGNKTFTVFPLGTDANQEDGVSYIALPIYSSKDSSVNGTVSCDGSNTHFTYQYAVTLKAGWQWVALWQYASTGQGQKTEYFSKIGNIPNSNITWYANGK